MRLLGSNDAQAVHYVAAAAILVTATFNIIGVKLGSLVQNLTTGTKYAALVVLVLAAFLIGGRNDAPANAPAALSADQIATDGAALSKNDVVGLLGGGVPASRVREVVEARGVNFRPTPEILNQINAVGGDGSLGEVISRTAPSLIALFGLAFISLLWVYDGWADVTFLSGEVKRPERFLPLALICGRWPW